MFLTNQQRRAHALNKAITLYLFESGETKKSFIARLNMPESTFFKKQRNPETFTLGELWSILDVINMTPDQKAKLLE